MPLPTAAPDQYRPAAGIAVFNSKGQVWLGERKGETGKFRWQFPQGGIDKGEAPIEGAFRELWEETGLKRKHVKLLGEVQDWLYYDFPPEYKGRKSVKGWRGQRQKWFAVCLISSEDKIDLTAHKPIEFSNWRWDHLENAPKHIVPFKKHVYERLVVEFEGYANSLK